MEWSYLGMRTSPKEKMGRQVTHFNGIEEQLSGNEIISNHSNDGLQKGHTERKAT